MNAIDEVREGMRVVGPGGEKIGVVKDVRMADPDAVTAERQTDPMTGGLRVEPVKEFASEASLTQHAAERLLRIGYVEIHLSGFRGGRAYFGSDELDRGEATPCGSWWPDQHPEDPGRSRPMVVGAIVRASAAAWTAPTAGEVPAHAEPRGPAPGAARSAHHRAVAAAALGARPARRSGPAPPRADRRRREPTQARRLGLRRAPQHLQRPTE